MEFTLLIDKLRIVGENKLDIEKGDLVQGSSHCGLEIKARKATVVETKTTGLFN